MRILLTSHAFWPQLGGIETSSVLIATELSRMGHEVTVLTETPHSGPEPFEFAVVRCPSITRLWKLARAHDVTFQNNISLRSGWISLLARRPVVSIIAIWLTGQRRLGVVKQLLKQVTLFFYTSVIAVSEPIAGHLYRRSVVISNCYDPAVFDVPPVRQTSGILFAGRLIPDKGAHHLLVAVAKLRNESDFPELGPITIAGAGPQLPDLIRLAETLDLTDMVQFEGGVTSTKLSALMHRHAVLAVPSIWKEPFGIVAVEGLASGMVPVVSSASGLEEAVGMAGVVFKRGNVDDLANAIVRAFERVKLEATIPDSTILHLRSLHPDSICSRYVDLLTKAITTRGTYRLETLR